MTQAISGRFLSYISAFSNLQTLGHYLLIFCFSSAPAFTFATHIFRHYCNFGLSLAIHELSAIVLQPSTCHYQNADKPRLMKVTVDTLESKAFILRNCTKLRSADQSSYYSNIYITPDLTPTEREANRQLRAKLDVLNKDGKQYKIKNGRIVPRVD